MTGTQGTGGPVGPGPEVATLSAGGARVVPIPAQPRGILALDIDGTLLGPGGHLGDRTRHAVHAAGEAGWLVTLATGRRWASTKPVADELGLESPLIVYNGALIRDSVTAEVLFYNPLPHHVVEPLVRALVARGLQPVVYEDVAAGERLLSGPAEHDPPILAAWLAGIPVERLLYDELANVGTAVRLLAYDEVAKVRGVEDLAHELGLEYRTLWYPVEHDDKQMAELLHPSGTKAAALHALAARYGLTMAEVVAAGDGHNDVEMLAEAGVGVAMGQAPEEVRRHAALTIGHHVDEGLAEFIERELLHGDGFPHHLVQRRRAG